MLDEILQSQPRTSLPRFPREGAGRMCLGGGGDGGAGATQRRIEELEAERQARIKEGAALINSQFDSKFNDQFYGDFQKSFLDFFTPQLDDQFNAARGDVISALTNRGNLKSSAGIRMLQDVEKKNATERNLLANRAQDEASNLRSGVENERANLFSLNESSADPERLAPLVTSSATALTAPQAFTPLEGVFASVLDNVTRFQNARLNSPAATYRPSSSAAATIGSSGSGAVRR